MSRPTISKAQTSYPIYAATFANNKPSQLIVGGGGGAGKHGVKNKITLFDFSSRAPTVEPSAELEVSEDDSVTCLANLATKDGVILYAGNGSSVDDKVQGKDMHFRSFEVQFPKAKATGTGAGKIAFMSKTQVLKAPKADAAKKEAYMRLLRLSPSRPSANTPNKRIGAVASALAGDENELVVFSATSNRPEPQDIINRVALGNKEANDVDIQDTEDGQFQVAYTLDYEVHVHNIDYDFAKRKSRKGSDGRKVYTVPQVDLGEKRGRPKLRCVRWLSPKHLLLLVNKPNRSGVELWLLHLYEEGPGSIILKKKLPRSVGAATDLDVALLDANSNGAYQIAIAVAGIDVSLSVYTMDYKGQDSLSRFHHYATYDNVHEQSITKVVFSPFYKPESPGKPQYLRLASTSLGNTVSVETFTLVPDNSRYVLQTARTRNIYSAATYLVIAIVVATVALLLQSLVDPEGHLTRGIIPAPLQNVAGRTFGEAHRSKRHGAVLNTKPDTPAVRAERRIRELLHLANPPMGSETSQTEKALVIHPNTETEGGLSTEVHDSSEEALKKHVEAKRWHELSEQEQKVWKQKLVDAGMWTVNEGETILKSIFFGQIGGLVGQVAHGVLAG